MLPASSRGSGATLAKAALSSVVVFSVAGCVRNVERTVDAREDVAVWDFPIELPQNTLHLWPTAPGSPLRTKRHLDTKTASGQLAATVAGDDPYFVWQVETPIAAFGVHVVVEAEQPGPLQLFWSTPKCPVFSETCSTTFQLSPGRQAIEFLLDARDPLREVRLDLPDRAGTRLVFDEIWVLRSAELGLAFAPNASVGQVAESPSGLYIDALSADPWLTAFTPGLDADRITRAELVLRGAPGSAPQLYWGKATSGVSEPMSAHLDAADGGDLTHSAKLRGRPGWAGKLDVLRLDPGQGPGRYVIERLALIHDPAD